MWWLLVPLWLAWWVRWCEVAGEFTAPQLNALTHLRTEVPWRASGVLPTRRYCFARWLYEHHKIDG